jgi:hypothetical protein
MVLSSDETSYAYVYEQALSGAYLGTGLKPEVLANIAAVGRISAEKCRSAAAEGERRPMKLDLRWLGMAAGNSRGA